MSAFSRRRVRAVLLLASLAIGRGAFGAVEADPFVGTDGSGHTTPAATVPFGFVQAGPDTGNVEWEYCSGYRSGDTTLRGFSQTHLSGTGCRDLGDVLLLPFAADLDCTGKPVQAFEPDSQTARPGFYACRLADGVTVEVTATKRVARYRFGFPEGAVPRLLVDTQYGIVFHAPDESRHVLAATSRALPEGRILGSNHVKMWCTREYHFVVACSRPWTKLTELAPRTADERAKRYVAEFDAAGPRVLEVDVALSTVSTDGAEAALRQEAEGRAFDATRTAAEAAWAHRLAVADLVADRRARRIFKSALYHLFVQPNDISDVDGRYRGADGKVGRVRNGAYLTTLSTWDACRAAFPLYTLLAPEIVPQLMETFVLQAEAVGYLPIWTLMGRDTQCMVADHSVAILVDAWLKGFRAEGVSEARILAALEGTQGGRGERLKNDYAKIDRYGWIPVESVPKEAVSRHLEICYDDWCAARFARAVGADDQADRWEARSRTWRNLFDPATGFLRGRDAQGQWAEPAAWKGVFSPTRLHGNYTEGNAWQYLWQVMHDPEGLVEALGGRARACAKLEEMLATEGGFPTGVASRDVTGRIGQYAHGNEPCHHVFYLFPRLGRPDLAAKYVREVCRRYYDDTPSGLCGNDDCGQIGAWYLFSAMGFYPANPCAADYVLGAPQVPRVDLNLAGGRRFTMVATNLSETNRYVKAVTLDGKPLTGFALRHADILAGGRLVFEMTDAPQGGKGR